jgi:hypothetical protein
MAPFLVSPAVSQPATVEPSKAPLPVVIYPSPTHNTVPPDLGPPAYVPQPPEATEDYQPDQYVLVGGVGGFFDRNRHFHPARGSIAVGARSRVVSIRAEPNFRRSAPGGMARRGR